MKGNRFEGLSDHQWQVLEIFLPREPEKRGKGKPHTPCREVCNSILWILINGLDGVIYQKESSGLQDPQLIDG